MTSTGFRLLDTLDLVGQTYFRLKHTELWASFKVCEVLVEAHRLYRKWRSIPGCVENLRSPLAARRSKGVHELEALSSKNTGTTAFSIRALELGALPGILSCLSHPSATAVCAALSVLSDVFSHPLCKSAFTHRVVREIFGLLRIEDLHTRVRSAVLLALLTMEPETRETLRSLAWMESSFVTKMTDLICKPLPERYQTAIDYPNLQMNHSTLKHLRTCECHVRKSGVALFHLISNDKQQQQRMQNVDMTKIIPVLVRSVRSDDAGLRMASLRCLKAVVKEPTRPNLDLVGVSIAQSWREIMPKLRDMETLQAIEDLGVHPELLDRLIQDVYFLHRLPNLLTCKQWSVRTMAFRSLYPFTLMDRHRWKVVRSGLLHLIFRGLFDGNKSIHISALICLSQLCACHEVFMAVQAEVAQQPLFPHKMGEYLVYLVLSFPLDDIGQGALKLLGECMPKIRHLPRKIFANLSRLLSQADDAHRTGTARLVTKLAQVEKFRRHLLQSPIVTELIDQATVSEGECRAAVLEALGKFSVTKCVADHVASVKGLTDSLWTAQESDDHDLAVAALELLRVLSKSLGYLPGGEGRIIKVDTGCSYHSSSNKDNHNE